MPRPEPTSEPTSSRPSKSALRRQFRAARRALSPAEHAQSSARIVGYLLLWLDSLDFSPRALALYLAAPHEASLDALIEPLQLRGVRVAAPRGDGFALISSASTCRALGAQSWREADGETIAAEEIDIFLLPGVAFGRDGSRLGQGGGWYDQALQGSENSRAILVGVAFACQLVDSVPTEAHDVAVQWIVSENGAVEVAA